MLTRHTKVYDLGWADDKNPPAVIRADFKKASPSINMACLTLFSPHKDSNVGPA
jgi:hypothetical protein